MRYYSVTRRLTPAVRVGVKCAKSREILREGYCGLPLFGLFYVVRLSKLHGLSGQERALLVTLRLMTAKFDLLVTKSHFRRTNDILFRAMLDVKIPVWLMYAGGCLSDKNETESLRGKKLYIDPEECIDCGAAIPSVCGAIFGRRRRDQWNHYQVDAVVQGQKGYPLPPDFPALEKG